MQVLYNAMVSLLQFRLGWLVFICWEILVWSLSYSLLEKLGGGPLSVNRKRFVVVSTMSAFAY